MQKPRLFLTPDANLQRNIKMKRLSFSSPPVKPIIESVKMFNQFYIFGAPPDPSYPLEPTLLTAFPSTSKSLIQKESFLDQLKLFSFPSGLHKITKSNQILLQEFVFYLTTGICQKTYGICVHFAAPSTNSPYFATRHNREYPFCICFLTEIPFLVSHFQFASFLALYLCGAQKPLITAKERKRIPLTVQGFCPKPLILDRNFPSFAVLKGFSVPKTLFDLIFYFYQLPSPILPVQTCRLPSIQNENSDTNSEKFSKTVKNLPKECCPIILSYDVSLFIPYQFSYTQCLTYPTFHAFFSHLSPSTIVHIYTAIILERCVLFVSNDLQLASFSVIASTSLISPFITQATVMPILPNDEHFQDILQSPVPYVAGSTKTNENADVICYLDDNIVSIPKSLPKLPNHDELVHRLETLLESASKSILSPPKYNKSFFGNQTINPDYEKFVKDANIFTFPSTFAQYNTLKYILSPLVIEEILSIFADFFPLALSENLKSCFVTDTTDPETPITVVDHVLLNSIVPEDEREFYKIFTSTQIFVDFSEKITDSFSKEKVQKKLRFDDIENSPRQNFKLNCPQFSNSTPSLI